MGNKIHSRGYVMLKIKNTGVLSKIKQIIKPEDIDPENGLETEYHVTILYGIEPGITTDQIKEKIKDIDINEIIVNGMSLFENETDVLKLDVFPDDEMLEMRKYLKELPNNETYPEYKAHITLAYLKSGTGAKYLPNPDKFIEPIFLKVEDIIYSHGGKNKFDIINESLKYNKRIL